MSHANLVSKLMEIRKGWTMQDFKDAYGDGEWFEIPETLEECREQMEDYIHNTYDTDYIKECIEDESL